MIRPFIAFLAALALSAAPALAKSFVHDDAQMLSASTVAQLDSRISNFNAQTGKEVVVQTVPSVSGGDVRAAAEAAFAQQQVNGVLIFVDKGDRKDWIIPDHAAVQAGWWSSQTSSSIARSMEAQFKAGDFDAGVTSAVDGALNVYRSHMGSLRSGSQPSAVQRGTYAQQPSQGVHISMFWWIIIAVVGFFIIRSIMRSASGPRSYGGPGGPGAPGPGGPGYGGGYGYGGGGGGFFSGLLGGLGGAFLGNELFNRGGDVGNGAWSNTDPTAGGAAPDAGGWQSDPGQADTGGGGGGDWGGGGFGGGGDFGGGGGGDSGGGW